MQNSLHYFYNPMIHKLGRENSNLYHAPVLWGKFLFFFTWRGENLSNRSCSIDQSCFEKKAGMGYSLFHYYSLGNFVWKMDLRMLNKCIKKKLILSLSFYKYHHTNNVIQYDYSIFWIVLYTSSRFFFRKSLQSDT